MTIPLTDPFQNIIKTAAILIVIGGLLTSCGSLAGDKQVFHENGVEIVTRERVSLVPHGMGGEYLEVRGKSFSNLYSPSYVFIPEWNSIIFLTHREGFSYILHIFSLDKKLDIALKQDGAFVGGGLGYPKTDSSACYVEKVDGDIAVLVKRGFKSPDLRVELNRAKKTLRPVR